MFGEPVEPQNFAKFLTLRLRLGIKNSYQSMSRHFKSKHFHFSWIISVIAAAAALFYINQHYQTEVSTDPLIIDHQTKNIPLPAVTTLGEKPNNNFQIPSTLSLPVPFTPQAPTGNWDQLHNEACEEASSIMANAYFSGMTDVTLKPEFVEQQITSLTQWEQNNFGYFLDINSQEVVKMITANYNLQAKVVEGNFTSDDIKKELTQNHLVLLPADGKLLGNPNFRNPGPPYHMLVLKGYVGNQIITNDPGTRKGLNYPYTFTTLYQANGNFDHATHEVDLTDKNYIVVWK